MNMMKITEMIISWHTRGKKKDMHSISRMEIAAMMGQDLPSGTRQR